MNKKLIGIVVSLVVASCCVLGVIAQALGKTDENAAPATVVPTIEATVTQIIPTNTSVPEPTSTSEALTFDQCRQEVIDWSTQLRPIFEEATYLGDYITSRDSENGMVFATLIVAKMEAIDPPACDVDAQFVHFQYIKAIQLVQDGFRVMDTDTAQAVVYITEGNELLATVVSDLKRLILKYS